MHYRMSIIIHSARQSIADSVMDSYEIHNSFSFELFHEQLPLPVPCYDLLPVTELTVIRVNELRVFPAPLS